MTPEIITEDIIIIWPNGFGMSLRLQKDLKPDLNYSEIFYGKRSRTRYVEGLGAVHERDNNYSLVVVEVDSNFKKTERHAKPDELRMFIDEAVLSYPNSPHTQMLLSEYCGA